MQLSLFVGWIAGVIINELLKTLINRNRWRVNRSGERRDSSHVKKWFDAAGKSWGQDTPSRQDVYEHYHGEGSWNGRCVRVVSGWRLLALALSSCCGTLVTHAISAIPQKEMAGYFLGMVLLIGLISLVSAGVRDLFA